MTPWYVPAGATLGVLLAIAALVKARTVWRILALVLVVILAGLSWTFIITTKAPPYSGPVVVGKPIPAFSTVRVGGAAFTQRDLEGQRSVLISFRGRW